MPLLDWLNKDQAVKQVNQVPYRLLQPVPELSFGDPNNENMLIQGDNLDALKALLPLYAGKVKCIYIDPPYNTKSAFEHYDDNLEHSQWLSMMYPRLELLWELLCPESGVILISINDDEVHYLKVICDQIFGRSNFITSLVWNYEGNTDNQAYITNYHEYILVYAKSGNIEPTGVIDPNIDMTSKLYKDEIRNTVVKNGPKNPVSSVTLPKGFPSSIEEGEIDITQIEWPKYQENLVIKDFALQKETIASSGWASKKLLESFIDNNFEYVLDTKNQKTKFEISSTGAIEGVKQREKDKGHFISVLRGLGTTNQMRLLLSKLGIKFTYPKPVNLISYLIEAFSKDGDLVLDSFSGSGTTAHSVFGVNQRHRGNRKFIAIEMSEHNAERVIFPRLKEVIDGNSKAGLPGVDGGFYYYRLGEPIFDEYGCIRGDIRFAELAAHVWYLETRTPLLKKRRSPLLGVHNGIAYYLLYNGILGDRKPKGGNVLTGPILSQLAKHDGPKVIFGETSRLGEARLKDEQITFKQIPYDVRAR